MCSILGALAAQRRERGRFRHSMASDSAAPRDPVTPAGSFATQAESLIPADARPRQVVDAQGNHQHPCTGSQSCCLTRASAAPVGRTRLKSSRGSRFES
eukprot:6210327-Pleurochrysis_carterae.AAC.5